MRNARADLGCYVPVADAAMRELPKFRGSRDNQGTCLSHAGTQPSVEPSTAPKISSNEATRLASPIASAPMPMVGPSPLSPSLPSPAIGAEGSLGRMGLMDCVQLPAGNASPPILAATVVGGQQPKFLSGPSPQPFAEPSRVGQPGRFCVTGVANQNWPPQAIPRRSSAESQAPLRGTGAECGMPADKMRRLG